MTTTKKKYPPAFTANNANYYPRTEPYELEGEMVADYDCMPLGLDGKMTGSCHFVIWPVASAYRQQQVSE